MDWKTILPTLYRNRIETVFSAAQQPLPVGASKFGGRPDVPDGFIWPIFDRNGEERPRPLAFLAQFSCKELVPLDKDGVLPKTGLLSFFYELDSQPWGFDPKDMGCARVYWFDTEKLMSKEYPAELQEEYRLPELSVQLSSGVDVADWADACPALRYDWVANELRYYDAARREMGLSYPNNRSKLLGWADILQNNMTLECELVSRGYYMGGSWEKIPEEERDTLRSPSVEDWLLLFQLDTVEQGAFELMFGDCGRIYFYIRKEDLATRRFDRVWLIQQCC